MINTTSTFESSHRFTKELQRELEEALIQGKTIPNAITVSKEIFALMVREVGVPGIGELRLPITDPRCFRYIYEPHLYQHPPHAVVRVVPQ